MLRKRLVKVTDYFFGLPDSLSSLAFIILVSLAFGLIQFGAAGPLASAASGLLALAIPGILVSAATVSIRPRIGTKRLLFLSLVSALVYSLAFLLHLQAVAFAVSFALWFAVSRIFFGLDDGGSLALAAFQFVSFAIPSAYLGLFGPQTQVAIAIATALGLSIASTLVFLSVMRLIGLPFSRVFGLELMDGLSQFFGQWLYGSRELEQTFSRLGETVESEVGVLLFRAKSMELAILVPGVHFGPFGNLGGSRFSHMLASAISKGGRKAIVLHGTAGHELNPVAESEFGSLLSVTEKAISAISRTSPSCSFSAAKSGAETAYALRISENALVTLTRAPLSTEDISHEAGAALRGVALGYCGEAVIADAHNCETAEFEPVPENSAIASSYGDAIRKALGSESLSRQKPLRLGYAEAFPEHPSIGKGGVKLCLVESGRGHSAFAMLVFDANGILPEFRELLISKMSEMASGKLGEFLCEIYTTDTHEMNVRRGVVNAVGSVQKERLEKLAAGLFGSALANLSQAEAGMRVEKFRFRAFGKKSLEAMMSAIAESLNYAKICLVALAIGAAIFAHLFPRA